MARSPRNHLIRPFERRKQPTEILLYYFIRLFESASLQCRTLTRLRLMAFQIVKDPASHCIYKKKMVSKGVKNPLAKNSDTFFALRHHHRQIAKVSSLQTSRLTENKFTRSSNSCQDFFSNQLFPMLWVRDRRIRKVREAVNDYFLSPLEPRPSPTPEDVKKHPRPSLFSAGLERNPRR